MNTASAQAYRRNVHKNREVLLGGKLRPSAHFELDILDYVDDAAHPFLSVAGIRSGGWRGLFMSFVRSLIVFLALMSAFVLTYEARYQNFGGTRLTIIVVIWLTAAYVHAGYGRLKRAGWLKITPLVAAVLYGIYQLHFVIS
jgi:hypothetical protein